jgi:hypothetical protein
MSAVSGERVQQPTRGDAFRPCLPNGSRRAFAIAARRVGEIGLFGCAPLLLVVGFALFAPRETYAWDFHAFWGAAANVVHGRSPYLGFGANASGTPYPLYLYPPVLAEALAPLGTLPFAVAATLFVTASIGAILYALWLLGVRDWRCYGATFLWVPVLHGLRLGTLTPFLVLGLAVCWRLRERKWMAPVLAAVVTSKLFLWPVMVMSASRRGLVSTIRLACWTVACLIGSWAVIGFAGFTRYPSLLVSTQRVWVRGGYGFGGLLMRSGVSQSAVSVALFAAAAACLAVLARSSDDRVRFAGSIIVACGFSPAAWLHYAALLLVVVAIFQPYLGWAWVLPLAFWLSPREQADGNVARVTIWTVVLIAVFVIAKRSGDEVAFPPVGVPQQRA